MNLHTIDDRKVYTFASGAAYGDALMAGFAPEVGSVIGTWDSYDFKSGLTLWHFSEYGAEDPEEFMSPRPLDEAEAAATECVEYLEMMGVLSLSIELAMMLDD